MKKDLPFVIGGLAVGAIVVYAFKDQIFGKKKKAQTSSGSVSTPAPTPQPQTGGATPQVQGQQTEGSSGQPAQQPVSNPYDLVPIQQELRNTPFYDKIFGGCDFPILPDASSPCVEKLQTALEVEQTGTFDSATQQAFDKYIEKMPNRSDSDFKGWGIQGCIVFDPATGSEINTCGLNHDQYLDILFKMGIPLTDSGL